VAQRARGSRERGTGLFGAHTYWCRGEGGWAVWRREKARETAREAGLGSRAVFWCSSPSSAEASQTHPKFSQTLCVATLVGCTTIRSAHLVSPVVGEW